MKTPLPQELIELDYPLLRYVLPRLLTDKTTGRNIVWATDSYADRGPEYAPDAEITIDALIKLGKDFCPRVLKQDSERRKRSKERAEVFTPSWVCAYMNDFCDQDWLGRKKPIFTKKTERGYEVQERKVFFGTKKRKSWKRYVDSRRLEITCGEAPFIVSRYDAATGEKLAIQDRIGVLDRKLRVIAENVNEEGKDVWLKAALRAFESVYGYEYQGDNLLIARINLLMTLIEYFNDRFEDRDQFLDYKELNKFANVVAWNFVQMDGLTFEPPVKTNETNVEMAPSQCQMRFKQMDDDSSENGFYGTTLIPENSDRVFVKARDWRTRHPYTFKNRTKGGKTLKFDYVIGNPPYQEDRDGTSAARPVYHNFMDACYEVGESALLITPGRFLIGAGYTPADWNEKMLSSQNLKVLHYEPNSKNVFTDVDIKGGVVITYWDKNKTFEPIEVFFVFPELKQIYKKVVNGDEFRTIDDLICRQNKWNFSVLYKEHPELKSLIGSGGKDKRLRTSSFMQLPIFRNTGGGNDYKLIGLIKNKRVYRYIPKKYIDQNHPNLFKYKVLVPASNGSGALGEGLSTPLIGEPLIGEPLIGYTETFIGIGAFETRSEAEAALKYIKSKFARTLLGIIKVTQHNQKGTWKYVPLQDFTPHSDIDWTQSVAEIDRQLYAKYGLTESEINFIETKVRAME